MAKYRLKIRTYKNCTKEIYLQRRFLFLWWNVNEIAYTDIEYARERLAEYNGRKSHKTTYEA